MSVFGSVNPHYGARKMIADQTQDNKNQSTRTPATTTQADFDEWVIGSGVSSVRARLYLKSLDDPRVIVYGASQSIETIGEVV